METKLAEIQDDKFTLEENYRNLERSLSIKDDEIAAAKREVSRLKEEISQSQSDAHAKRLACLMQSVVEFTNKQTKLLTVAVDAINVL